VTPDLSVLWVIVFVLLLTAIVNRLLFRPVLTVVDQRQEAVRSARALAGESAERASRAAAEFDAQTTAARQEVYAAMDERRRRAVEVRTALLASTRQEADTLRTDAVRQLEASAAEARRRLEADARNFGDLIVERVLERRPS